MRVAVVSDYAALSGGITVFLDNLTRHLASDAVFTLVAWAPAYGSAATPAETGGSFREVIEVRHGDVQSAALAIGQCDLAFLQTSWNVRLLAVLASAFCESLGVPLVTVVHTTSHSNPESVARPVQEKWLNEILSRSARVICVSQDVRRALEPLAPGVRLDVIGNASRFRPSDCSERSSAVDRNVLTYIGRTGHAKGVDDFFKIARSLADTELKFVCNGLYPDILGLAASAPENVELCHSLDAEGMLRLYCRSHAIVATYRCSEGLPLALLEALSLGVPVLGYGSPGVLELLEAHDQFVAPVGDHQGIVERIRAWLGGGADFTRPQAESVPHWSSTAYEYLRLFRELAP